MSHITYPLKTALIHVRPWKLETTAQRLFEAYGGPGRDTERRVADTHWFMRCRSAVPTWSLGCTANAAFRASIFSHPGIGLMDEALGPGMPSGVGEDTYLFYKVLKAGYSIVYEPEAWVWHKHRHDVQALRQQIFNYSKGHVAYHLTTLLRDGETFSQLEWKIAQFRSSFDEFHSTNDENRLPTTFFEGKLRFLEGISGLWYAPAVFWSLRGLF